jgi:hypothetical protein
MVATSLTWHTNGEYDLGTLIGKLSAKNNQCPFKTNLGYPVRPFGFIAPKL